MCSMYWTIKDISLSCPRCGKKGVWNIQTHFLGEVGSCLNYYALGQKVSELRGVKRAMLDGINEDFIGGCPECGQTILFGAEIEDEYVKSVFPLADTKDAPSKETYT